MKKKRRKMQWITRICGGMLAAWFVMALCTPVFLHAAGSNAGEKITVDDAGHSEGFAAILYDNTNGLLTSEANAILRRTRVFCGSKAGNSF